MKKLLWIPPVAPSHALRGVFARYRGFSKSLVFSENLSSIPTAVSALLNEQMEAHRECTILQRKNLKRELKTRYFQDFSDDCVEAFVTMLERCGGDVFPSQKPCFQMILDYCDAGCLDDVLREFEYLYGEESEKTLLSVLKAGNEKGWPFAVPIIGEDAANIGDLRMRFNSPFGPFAIVTTSIGKEGVDFHLYCDRLIHYVCPTSFVDWDQKNGRIDRRDSLAVRRWWAKPENLLELLDDGRMAEESGGLSPHWNAGKDMLHYYYLYIEGSSEEVRFRKVRREVEENRMVLGSDGRTIGIEGTNDSINLSPYLRER